jgi:hypothetical protein
MLKHNGELSMIRVTGGSVSQKKHTVSIVNYCINKLMPRIGNLDIVVRLRDLKGSAYGYCMALGDDGERADRPRTFEIEVEKNMPLRKLLETVAHEMVHVKQYARGELYQGVRVNKHRWQGKWISNNVDYWDSPWEIEAHGREAGLFIRWAEENDLAKKKWTHDD